MAKKAKTMTEEIEEDFIEDDFDLIDDESEHETAHAKIVSKPSKKVATKKKSKDKSGPPTEVVSVRVPVGTIKEIHDNNLDVAKLFKKFCEDRVFKNKVCPTCKRNLD